MWGIGSTLRRRWPEIVLIGLAALNVVVVFGVRQWEIVPFHLVWASLAVLLGLRAWTVGKTATVVGGVVLATGLPLAYTVSRGLEPVAELSEVPLICGIFVAMISCTRSYISNSSPSRLSRAKTLFLSNV